MELPDDVKQVVLNVQEGLCPCGRGMDEFYRKLPDNEYRRKKYPHFIDSFFNVVGLCKECVDSGKHEIKDSYAEVAEVILREPAIA